jgi:dihydroorotate dehydrogenase electron transfer subunit
MTFPCRVELTVTDNVPFGQFGERGFFALTLDPPAWSEWQPGQFVMIRPRGWERELAWARPLSISRLTRQSLVLFFQVVGRGTSRLARLRAGDKVIVWGPLGNGFTIEAGTPTLLLAGGMGIAPFSGYIDRHPDPSLLSMLFGHRLDIHNYPAETLARHIDVEIFRETSARDLALFQERIRACMRACREKKGLVLACGPMPFVRMIGRYAQEIELRAQLSLEQRMACGVGACLGCVARTSAAWPDADAAGLPVQTCTKGPVFWAEHLDLDEGKAEAGA